MLWSKLQLPFHLQKKRVTIQCPPTVNRHKAGKGSRKTTETPRKSCYPVCHEMY